MFGSIFDAVGDAFSWVGDTVSSIFSPADDYDIYGAFTDTALDTGVSASSGGLFSGASDWLSSKGFKAAMGGGAQALLSPRNRGGGGGGGSVSYAGRLSANTAADRLPVQAMGDARGPRAIVSEEPNTIDAYWSDRMRQFGRLSDVNSATKAK